jgi:hypothetical protein
VRNVNWRILIAAVILTLVFTGGAYADEGRREESQPSTEELNVTDTVIVAPAPTEAEIHEETSEIPDPENREGGDEAPEDDVTIGIDESKEGEASPFVGEDTGDATPKDISDHEGQQSGEPPEDDVTIGDEEKSGEPLIAPLIGPGDEDVLPGDKPNAIAVPIITTVGCAALVLGAALKKH